MDGLVNAHHVVVAVLDSADLSSLWIWGLVMQQFNVQVVATLIGGGGHGQA